MGPCPMQLVVVSAVRNAVRAATIIFTATSISLFRFIEKKKYTFKFLRILEVSSVASAERTFRLTRIYVFLILIVCRFLTSSIFENPSSIFVNLYLWLIGVPIDGYSCEKVFVSNSCLEFMWKRLWRLFTQIQDTNDSRIQDINFNCSSFIVNYELSIIHFFIIHYSLEEKSEGFCPQLF